MDDLAARVRAARAYADLNQDQLAERLGLEKQSVVRTEAGTRDPKRLEQIAIAHVCGVPVEFMTDGFQRAQLAAADGGTVGELFSLLREVLDRQARLEELLTERELSDLEAEAERQPTDTRAGRRAAGGS